MKACCNSYTKIERVLASGPIITSAPCRIDLGGTLDLSTFHLPLQHLSPCTFNIAIGLRTQVTLKAHRQGYLKISSSGFDELEYQLDDIPFDHSLGLICAVCAHFRISGIHISIDSASPPRSALGGSSVAAVALIAAITKLFDSAELNLLYSARKTALLAHQIEQSVAGVPCGLQDHLSAVYGGINLWYWHGDTNIFTRKQIGIEPHQIEQNLLLAYCGKPHESKNINQTWVDQFLSGKFRYCWHDIINLTHSFADALHKSDYKEAIAIMDQEVDLRMRMTPQVFDTTGLLLLDAARNLNCGARFTGAGGGGCVWALGEQEAILNLKEAWSAILESQEKACLLPLKIDTHGLQF